MMKIPAPLPAAVIRESALELMCCVVESVEMAFWQLGNNVTLISPTLCVVLQGADFNQHHGNAGGVQGCVMWQSFVVEVQLHVPQIYF